MSPHIRVFLRKADDVLAQLRTESQRAPGQRCAPLNDSDLDYFVTAIEKMRYQAEQGAIVPTHQRYRVLTRIIADQWPLGSSLGNEISELERMFVDL